MRKVLTVLVIAALAAMVAGCGARRADGTVRGGWELLGQKRVNFRADNDQIVVTAREGTFRRLQLHVSENGVRIFSVNVHFANGESHSIPLRNFIPEGGKTRVIDLPGAARIIRRIGLNYRSERDIRDGRAMVKVYGKH